MTDKMTIQQAIQALGQLRYLGCRLPGDVDQDAVTEMAAAKLTLCSRDHAQKSLQYLVDNYEFWGIVEVNKAIEATAPAVVLPEHKALPPYRSTTKGMTQEQHDYWTRRITADVQSRIISAGIGQAMQGLVDSALEHNRAIGEAR